MSAPRNPAAKAVRAELDFLAGVADDQRAREQFDRMLRDEQIAAVHRMADEGHGDYSIAHATGWHVEQVRTVLAERREAKP